MTVNFASSARVISVVVLFALSGPVTAKTVVVTARNIVTAFAAAKSGDTLELVGTFKGLRIGNRRFSNAVTLDASKAKFTNTLVINNVTNLKVVGGTFNIAGRAAYTTAIAVGGGSGISFDQTTVIGSAGEFGIALGATTNARVSNGKFSGLRNAVGLGSVRNALITRNSITDADSDGIDIADSHGVTASYNSCSAGNPGPGNHPDCVQLWSVAGHPLQSNVTVSNNNATGPTQGFTSFSDGGGGERLHFISNKVATSFPQGIACYSCYVSTITGNRVSTLPGSAHLTNINVVGGIHNIVSGNVIKSYSPPRSYSMSLAAGILAEDESLAFDFAQITTASFTSSVDAVPEASTWTMLLIGFGAIGLICRRRPLGSRWATSGDRPVLGAS